MNPRRRAALVGAAACVIALALAACTRRPEPSPAIDVETMAYLSEARALHHQANLAEESGDLASAAHAMERLVAARRPHPERATAEIEEVLADAFARAAELHIKQHDLHRAAEAVRRGLEHAREPNYFRGHLLEVEGVLEETRATVLADAGKPDEAAQARKHAALLLEQVVTIQDEVIKRSLAKDGAQ